LKNIIKKTFTVFKNNILDQRDIALIKKTSFAFRNYVIREFREKIPQYLCFPKFIIIGAQRSGTTSLYYNLCNHPDIISSTEKQVNYFNYNYEKGLDWYKSHFPDKVLINLLNQNIVSGEASPEYMITPFVPYRIHQQIPEIKIIIILRDPIKRAYSQYSHNVRNGEEHLPFSKAIRLENKRLESIKKKYCDFYTRKEYYRYTYVERGKYSHYIDMWKKYFDPKKIHILKSESFFENPNEELNKIYTFLGLDHYNISHIDHYNKGEYKRKMDIKDLNYLKTIYSQWNAKLSTKYNIDYDLYE